MTVKELRQLKAKKERADGADESRKWTRFSPPRLRNFAGKFSGVDLL
ncbi:hypothetical protein [Salimicrobium humidisoli]|nr:hypothetical protein [Salimicrobium humidisoli]